LSYRTRSKFWRNPLILWNPKVHPPLQTIHFMGHFVGYSNPIVTYFSRRDVSTIYFHISKVSLLVNNLYHRHFEDFVMGILKPCTSFNTVLLWTLSWASLIRFRLSVLSGRIISAYLPLIPLRFSSPGRSSLMDIHCNVLHGAEQVLRNLYFCSKSGPYQHSWNQKIHYYVHKSPPPVPTLS
jgi:hypothetical protein